MNSLSYDFNNKNQTNTKKERLNKSKKSETHNGHKCVHDFKKNKNRDTPAAMPYPQLISNSSNRRTLNTTWNPHLLLDGHRETNLK